MISYIYYISIPEVVGSTKYSYSIKTINVEYDGIRLYGKALIPDNGTNSRFPTVIYAHGAESNHNADMTTLKSLAMSGIACYTFDFYGWSAKSTGPDGAGKFFRGRTWENRVLEQCKDLSAVIEKIKMMDFVNASPMTYDGKFLVTELFESDGIHLNRKGQLKWCKEYIQPQIEALIEKYDLIHLRR